MRYSDVNLASGWCTGITYSYKVGNTLEYTQLRDNLLPYIHEEQLTYRDQLYGNYAGNGTYFRSEYGFSLDVPIWVSGSVTWGEYVDNASSDTVFIDDAKGKINISVIFGIIGSPAFLKYEVASGSSIFK